MFPSKSTEGREGNQKNLLLPTQAVSKTSLPLKWYHTSNGIFSASAVRKIKW